MIQNPLRARLINIISAHTPFAPDEIDQLYSSAKSIDKVLEITKYAMVYGIANLTIAADESQQ